MADDGDNNSKIQAAVERARRRWLVSMTVNAGGRWAVVPGAVAALVGIALALAGWDWLALLIAVVVLGLVGVALVLGLSWWLYSRPGVAGAPDWTLLLDRALGLDDSLPTLLERGGGFSPLIEARVANALDAEREKQAAPPRHWGALIVALVLALMPLVFWRPDPDAEEPPADQIAEAAESDPARPQAEGDSKGGSGGSPGEGDPASGDEGEGNTGGGEEGEVQDRPREDDSEGNGAPPPEGELPQPESDNQPPENEGNVGEQDNPPQPPPAGEDPDIGDNLDHVKPDAGDGETRTEDRSRWVYDPDGEALDRSTPGSPDVRHPGEKTVPRTKLTSKERRAVERVFKKLHE